MDYDAKLKPTTFEPDWFSCPEIVRFSKVLKSANIPFVYFGGSVRDAIGTPKKPIDFDILADAHPETIRQGLADCSIDVYIDASNKVMARIGEIIFDISNRAQATVPIDADMLSPENLRDWILDADFTMNTLILTPEGGLYDFFGAVADIHTKHVRFIMDPVYAISRNPKRLLKYFRFCAEFGDMRIDEYALEACSSLKHHLEPASERYNKHYRATILKLLAAPHVAPILSRMHAYDMLSYVCGSPMASVAPITALVELEDNKCSSETLTIRIMALLMGSCLSPLQALEPLAKWLELPEKNCRKITSGFGLLPYIQLSMTKEKRLGLIETLQEATLDSLLMLRCAGEGDGKRAQELYMGLLQMFAEDGFVSDRLASTYIAMQAGKAPYALRCYHGFTLIELSIVLVIVGLITGSIVVGRDLIHAAEIRTAITQMERYNAAVNTFKNKFGCLPGDCPQTQAQQYGLSTSLPSSVLNYDFCGTYPGDGDGNIGYSAALDSGNPFPSCGDKETILFWQHLKDAGLFQDATTNIVYEGSPTYSASIPALKFSAVSSDLHKQGGISVFPGVLTLNSGANVFRNSHLFWISSEVGYPSASTNAGTNVLTVMDAYAIDKKLDDGMPWTGNVQAAGGTNNDGPTSPDVGPGLCVWDGGRGLSAKLKPYDDTSTSAQCSLVVKAAF